MKKISVITSVRNGERFLHRWIAHYGAAFGPENLHVILDGLDQARPSLDTGVNVIQTPYVARSRLAGDKFRAARASSLARDLFKTSDIVIGTDVDEFIVVDPKLNVSLADYLSSVAIRNSLSPLGIDVAPNANQEGPLDWTAPFLGQRRFGVISDRYTKTAILAKPLQWGSGQHRVRRHGFHIDPNLFLFHFGSVDQQETQARTNDPGRVANGWQAHQQRRNALLEEVTSTSAVPGDERFDSARQSLSRPRSLLSWNKPRPLKEGAVVEIPERFFGLV